MGATKEDTRMRFERTEHKTRRIIHTNYTANAHDEVTQVWTKDGWWNISIQRVGNR